MITCCEVCLGQPQGHAGVVTVRTRCLCRKSANPIFSVRICVTKELSAFVSDAWIRNPSWLIFSCCAAAEKRDRVPLYLVHCFCHSLNSMSLVTLLLFLVCNFVWLTNRCCSSGVSHHGGTRGASFGLSSRSAQRCLRLPGVGLAALCRPRAPFSFSAIFLHVFCKCFRLPFMRHLAFLCRRSKCSGIGGI